MRLLWLFEREDWSHVSLLSEGSEPPGVKRTQIGARHVAGNEAPAFWINEVESDSENLDGADWCRSPWHGLGTFSAIVRVFAW